MVSWFDTEAPADRCKHASMSITWNW
jgi:hypothetical protein